MSAAVRLGVEQQAIVAAPVPARVVGPSLTGKTTALRTRCMPGADPAVKPASGLRTALCATAAAAATFDGRATTFEQVASEILARYDRPVRILSPKRQAEMVARLLQAEDERAWPTLGSELGDPAFAGEVATTLCRYQASFLGDEELFTHAEAAGELERWEELAGFSRRYLAALASEQAADWAGVLVAASLLLRLPEVAAAVRGDLGELLVDDWQRATFALHRLLGQLAGPDGSVIVAGDPSSHVSGRMGASPRYLDDFPRRFGAAFDTEMDELRAWPPAPEAILADERYEGAALAGAVATTEADVVLARDDEETVRIRDLLESEGTTGCAVVPIEDAVSRHFAAVVVAGCRREVVARAPARWFDVELFGGPDVPSPSERADRAHAEERRAWNLAWTRATRRIALVAIEEPGPGFQLPDGLP